jgi:hypothetical protein
LRANFILSRDRFANSAQHGIKQTSVKASKQRSTQRDAGVKLALEFL